ncbi:MAG TPA: PQQ-dependent dehydrogenase, methanol/ethanol family [Steroidobacteraceae bacterium]|nr:PQQ-dependent dehydrogenase, methanol/ethanol family [Steroidobacteraceae bacterium]
MIGDRWLMFPAAALAAALFAAAPGAQAEPRGSRMVDNAVLGNEADGTDWPAYGRTFSESRFSPLAQINDSNVSRLGLAWALDLDVTNSITAPVEAAGVIYLAAGYSIVHAVRATDGRLLWRYDPKVPEASGQKLRAGWGIRGLALWKDKVYVGTQDGRLLALAAGTGQPVWSVQTLDPKNGAFISGAPRAFSGKIVIGNAGGDFSPVRGYVTAYDAETGKQLWRFYVVPGKPGSKDAAASDEVMDQAAKTWTGEWWKLGGGGNVWNSMTYDAEFNRLYLGTGNAGPSNWKIRSPGGGDNLYTASVVAVDADTGRYAWHYQTTPGDAWDYDSATDMTLATLNVQGLKRRVLLHAAKNGFFYVIDRDNGRLISAEKLGTVTWAERVDLATGRPVETPEARYRDKNVLLWPSFQAVHHWTPQSFSPLTGLVYVPTLEMPFPFGDEGVDKAHWNPTPLTPEFAGFTPGDADVPRDAAKSILKAWDPKLQREVWSIETPGMSEGGTVATAGNLVLQGRADGSLHAFSADHGKDLWSFNAGVAVTGVPITYSVDGRQYVTITSGPLNGATAAYGSVSARWGWASRGYPRRLLTFMLDGKAALPPAAAPSFAEPLAAPEFKVDVGLARAGAHEYVRCVLCHGTGVVAGGNAPDLRASPVLLSAAGFAAIVRDGALVSRGMPQFAELSESQLDSLRHYVMAKARESQDVHAK